MLVAQHALVCISNAFGIIACDLHMYSMRLVLSDYGRGSGSDSMGMPEVGCAVLGSKCKDVNVNVHPQCDCDCAI